MLSEAHSDAMTGSGVAGYYARSLVSMLVSMEKVRLASASVAAAVVEVAARRSTPDMQTEDGIHKAVRVSLDRETAFSHSAHLLLRSDGDVGARPSRRPDRPHSSRARGKRSESMEVCHTKYRPFHC